MLDMGFIHAIRRILKLLPRERQNLMFSATYSEDDPRSSPPACCSDPGAIEVAARNATAERIEQQVYRVPKEHKRHLLAHLIKQRQLAAGAGVHAHQARRQPPVASSCERPASSAAAIHGNKSQGARVRALERLQGAAPSPRWWPPKSPPAASTSRSCRTSSTTSCRTCPRTTCTASAAPRAREARVMRSRWSRPTRLPLLRDIEKVLARTLATSALPKFAVTGSPVARAAAA